MDEGPDARPVVPAGCGEDGEVVTGLGGHLPQGAQHLHLRQTQEQFLGKGEPVRQDHDDLDAGPVGSRHPGDQGPVDGLGTKILVFQVDELLGRQDGVDKEVPDFKDILGVQVGNAGLGPAHGHLVGGERNRPGAVEGEGGFAGGEAQVIGARLEPALGEQVDQFLHDRTGVVGLDVVVGTVGLAIPLDPPRVLFQVVAVVPAVRADVHPPDKGKAAVQYDVFLMMGGTQRVFAVKTKMQTLIGGPAEDHILKPFPLQ